MVNQTMRNSQLDISSMMERHPTLHTPAWPKFIPFSANHKPRTTDALKANITEEIQVVTSDVLARTFQNIARRVQTCLDANGGHFQHML